MWDWDDLRFLLALQRHGTMSAAAAALGINTATVSRRIEKLTADLGVPLFVRSGERWVASATALRLCLAAEAFDAGMRTGENTVAQSLTGAVSGQLRIAAPPGVISGVLAPRVAALLRAHPGVELRLRSRTSGALADDDILVRRGRPESGRLRARRLELVTLRGYRSSQAAGTAEGWVVLDGDPGEGSEVPPRLTVSLIEHQLVAMRSTGLAGLLPEMLASRLRDMAPVDGGETRDVELWLAYHVTRQTDPLVQLGAQWVTESFRALADPATAGLAA